MNALFDKAVAAVSRLPEAEQETIARELLERIDADRRWDELFADPRSDTLLRRLADEVRADIKAGRATDGDPATRR